jgi:hypothetical protein
VLLREFCQLERRRAERAVGAGRGAVAAPHGPDDLGRASGRQSGSVHAELPGAHGALWGDGGSDEPGEWPRERRLRARPSAFQGVSRAGVVVAWQPGFCQSRGLREFFAHGPGTAQRRASSTVGGGVAAVGGLAGTSSGEPGAVVGQGQPGEHDPGAAQHLLGAVAFERGMAGSARGRRDDRGVVRGAVASDCAAAAWPGQAPHRLPPCDRLAGAQTRGVGALLLPGGSVSDKPFSSSL